MFEVTVVSLNLEPIGGSVNVGVSSFQEHWFCLMNNDFCGICVGII